LFFTRKKNRQLIYYRAFATLRSEASRTYLSFLWWFLDPLLSMLVYYLVFGELLKRGTENFVAFLLVGVVTWQWFNNAVNGAANAINVQKNLVCQVSFPKLVLPSELILSCSIKFSVVFIILLAWLFAFGYFISWHIAYLPLVVITQYLLISASAYVCAIITTLIPDFQWILRHLLLLLMFLSGIFYSIDQVPVEYQFYFDFNPMAVIISAYRDVLLNQQIPNFTLLVPIMAVSLILILISLKLLDYLNPYIPRILLQR